MRAANVHVMHSCTMHAQRMRAQSVRAHHLSGLPACLPSCLPSHACTDGQCASPAWAACLPSATKRLCATGCLHRVIKRVLPGT
eukprot:362649-Chlamydomonas_euryale.AAC.1